MSDVGLGPAPDGDPVEMLAACWASIVLGGTDSDESISTAGRIGWLCNATGRGPGECADDAALAGWLACQIVNGHHPITGEPIE